MKYERCEAVLDYVSSQFYAWNPAHHTYGNYQNKLKMLINTRKISSNRDFKGAKTVLENFLTGAQQ